ncbi:hypothetical protein BDZ97DRAFT_2062168 [Flammula alnicola]|nr:hypothetical protein BDZ97DRAFT_2062168 [Flammula alnicola]
MNLSSKTTTTTGSFSSSRSTAIAAPTVTLLRLRCEAMGVGLMDIRTALKTLRTTCAALEMHAERLGSEIEELRAIITVADSDSGNQTFRGSQSAMNETYMGVVPKIQNQQGLLTPPATPARPLSHFDSEQTDESSTTPDTSRREGKTALVSAASSPGRGAKRKSSNSNLDQNAVSQVDDDNRPPKYRKRVRFAELVGDIPTSDVRTPVHDLNTPSDSEDLVLPAPRLVFRFPAQSGPFSLADTEPSPTIKTATSQPPTYVKLPRSINPVRGRSREHDRVTLTSQNILHRARKKTRWDPSAGKRVPISIPAPSSAKKRSKRAANAMEEDDYEGRLSRDFSKASLA